MEARPSWRNTGRPWSSPASAMAPGTSSTAPTTASLTIMTPPAVPPSNRRGRPPVPAPASRAYVGIVRPPEGARVPGASDATRTRGDARAGRATRETSGPERRPHARRRGPPAAPPEATDRLGPAQHGAGLEEAVGGDPHLERDHEHGATRRHPQEPVSRQQLVPDQRRPGERQPGREDQGRDARPAPVHPVLLLHATSGGP